MSSIFSGIIRPDASYISTKWTVSQECLCRVDLWPSWYSWFSRGWQVWMDHFQGWLPSPIWNTENMMGFVGLCLGLLGQLFNILEKPCCIASFKCDFASSGSICSYIVLIPRVKKHCSWQNLRKFSLLLKTDNVLGPFTSFNYWRCTEIQKMDRTKPWLGGMTVVSGITKSDFPPNSLLLLLLKPRLLRSLCFWCRKEYKEQKGEANRG